MQSPDSALCPVDDAGEAGTLGLVLRTSAQDPKVIGVGHGAMEGDHSRGSSGYPPQSSAVNEAWSQGKVELRSAVIVGNSGRC